MRVLIPAGATRTVSRRITTGPIADCSIALQLEPDEIAYNTRADAYHSKKDYDRAIADYNQVLLRPKTIPSRPYRI